MLTRIRKAKDENEEGFTLIELLVVMIIIGILAAIAIPVFLSQREKARDTSTKADVSTAGKEIATYFVDGTGTLLLTQAGGVGTDLTITDGTYTATIKVSTGTALQAAGAGFTAAPTNADWCVGLTNADGKQETYRYRATDGLSPGSCP